MFCLVGLLLFAVAGCYVLVCLFRLSELCFGSFVVALLLFFTCLDWCYLVVIWMVCFVWCCLCIVLGVLFAMVFDYVCLFCCDLLCVCFCCWCFGCLVYCSLIVLCLCLILVCVLVLCYVLV